MSSLPTGATGEDAEDGGCFFAAGNFLYLFGGGGLDNPKNTGGSTDITGVTDTQVTVGNWDSQGAGAPTKPRGFPSCLRIVPFFYVAGGASTATDTTSIRASTSIEFTVR